MLALAVAAPVHAQDAADESPAIAAAPLAPGTYAWDARELAARPIAASAAAEPLRVVVSLPEQRAHVYRGGRLVGAAAVSTGRAGKATPTGDYPILQKARWHRSNLYSNAPMPFMQRLTWSGIALHAGENPGYPASHGCIRLPEGFARDLFDRTALGTTVSVIETALPRPDPPALPPVRMARAEPPPAALPAPAALPQPVATPAPMPVAPPPVAPPVRIAAVAPPEPAPPASPARLDYALAAVLWYDWIPARFD
jgi:hypothetical protein